MLVSHADLQRPGRGVAVAQRVAAQLRVEERDLEPRHEPDLHYG